MPLFATFLLVVISAAVAFIDLRDRRIPNGLSASLLAAGFLVHTALDPGFLIWGLAGAVTGFLLIFSVGVLHKSLRGTDGIGMGDAKLFGAGGAWVGLMGLPWVMLIASFSGLAWVGVRRFIFGDKTIIRARIPFYAFWFSLPVKD
ncbi:MAG: prepilin peptidase [Alphaproteobacteria bacterium]|nr:MAG: prepilin peptidase [Alphaproteobacteria bacterium]